MPRLSDRALVLRSFQKYVRYRIELAIQRNVTRPNDPDYVEDALDQLALRQLIILESSRYFFQLVRYRRSESVEFDYEEAMSETSGSFNDEEFLRTFRVNKEQAGNLAMLLRETQQFEGIRTTQRPVIFQLLVFLYIVG